MSETKVMIENKEVAVSGRLIRMARLRHEGCDYVADPLRSVEQLARAGCGADIFTFLPEIYEERRNYLLRQGAATAAVLTITTFDTWWTGLHFKVRNKIRKAEKNGVELREAPLTDEFAKAVESIYNETPVRQGKKFWHYGKGAAEIKEELSSFMDRCTLVGAYYQGEMIGFMKVFHGYQVLRTIHIISKVSHRDKAIMDALVAWGVKLCEQKQVQHFQYGSWSTRSMGDFKEKHGFERVEYPRYFAALNERGKVILEFNLHRNIREYFPQDWIDRATRWRTKWNEIRFGKGAKAPATAGS